ncbi:hypothetical protein ACFMBG_11300 [Leisingera sp. D0M16]|uniref:hypothetical protein n=1 Tax=Leisingera coralii TaxID=3351347 RepID=UPI003B7E5FDC
MQRFMLTWAGAFLTVLVIFALFGQFLEAQPLWIRALLVSGMMAALILHVVGPAVMFILRRRVQ